LNEAAVAEARNPSYPGWSAAGLLVVTPRNETDFDKIEADIRQAVTASVGEVPHVVTVLAPAWTTDWIAPEALRKLHDAGIAPPGRAEASAADARPLRFTRAKPSVKCPNCGSFRTAELARFGSTACKAQYRCNDCLEPFDYFKPH